MGKLFWLLLRAGWRSLTFVATVVGLLSLWPDIEGLPALYDFSWAQAVPSRATLVIVILVGLLAWVVWIDVRPTFQAWRSSKKLSIRLDNASKAQVIGYYSIMTFYVTVINPSKSETIEDVRVKLVELKEIDALATSTPRRDLLTRYGADSEFTLLPTGETEVSLFSRKANIPQHGERIDQHLVFGPFPHPDGDPFSGPDGEGLRKECGRYQVDLEIFGRGIAKIPIRMFVSLTKNSQISTHLDEGQFLQFTKPEKDIHDSQAI